MENTKQDNSSRFIAYLSNHQILGQIQRISGATSERRLQTDDRVRNEYIAFMKKYQELEDT